MGSAGGRVMTSQSRSMPSGASEASVTGEPSGAAIDLYWLPLGAGGHFVRLNGRIYEAIRAFHERRRAFDLYHPRSRSVYLRVGT